MHLDYQSCLGNIIKIYKPGDTQMLKLAFNRPQKFLSMVGDYFFSRTLFVPLF